MPKRLIVALVVLALIITLGVVETVVLHQRYGQLHDMCLQLQPLADNSTITLSQYDQLVDMWRDTRKVSELCLPHMDVWEINTRIQEARSYVQCEQYEQVHANLAVLAELFYYIPHSTLPLPSHIL